MATYTFTADVEQAWGAFGAAAYPPTCAGPTGGPAGAGGYTYLMNTFSGGLYDFSVLGLRFDTSTLAAVITGPIVSATLSMYFIKGAGNYANDDSRNVVVAWKTLLANDCTDYTTTPGTDANTGVALSSTLASPTATVIPLTDPASHLNISGYTYLQLGIDGGAPAGANLLRTQGSSPLSKLTVVVGGGFQMMV